MKSFIAASVAIGSKVVAVMSTVLAISLASYSGFVLYDSVYTNRAAFMSSDLAQYKPAVEEEEPTFEEIQEINTDTCAWVTMKNTHIDYPIVQGKDDVEYANKDIYGKSSLTGSIYLTTINSNDFTDSFNLIYGHHMDNGAMFGDIEKYEDNNYFNSHQDGILVTTRGVYDIKIFGRLSADAYDSKVYAAGDRPSSDFPDYLYYLKSLSVQWDPSTDIKGITASIQKYLNARDKNIAENGRFVFNKMPEDAVKNGMQLIAFSTCADATTNGRQLLVGTMKFRTEPIPAEYYIDDSIVPLAAWGHGEAEHWSLLNAVCVIMALALTFPGKAIRKKYRAVTAGASKKRAARRTALNIQNNKDAGTGTGLDIQGRDTQGSAAGGAIDVRTSQKRSSVRSAGSDVQSRSRGAFNIRDYGDPRIAGALGQILLSVFAVAWFIITENPLKPMVIVDRWTLGMIAIFAAIWVIDVFVIKNYKKPAQTSPEPNI